MGMLVVFETYVREGCDPETLLSDEVKQDTMAQIMTEAQAEAVGFAVPPDAQKRARCFIACAPKDEPFIKSRLETHRDVNGFRAHSVETDG